MGLESIIGDLPLGIAIVLVLEGPWVALVISGKLQWISRVEKELDRQQVEHAAALKRADNDVLYYREAHAKERERADKATEKMAEVSREVGASMIHLLDSLPHSGDKLSPEQSAGGR